MIETYGVNATRHAWLGIDPGVTTGWALLEDDGALVAAGDAPDDAVARTIDEVIRMAHRLEYALDVVIEKMPGAGKMGHLASRLEVTRQEIRRVVIDVFDLPVMVVPPGEWKPSRVGRQKREWKRGTSQHQKDATTMALYVIDRESRRRPKQKRSYRR